MVTKFNYKDLEHRIQELEKALSTCRDTEETLRKGEAKAKRHQALITELAIEQVNQDVTLKRYLEKVCRIISEALDVARTSVWKLSDDGFELKCLMLYEEGERLNSNDLVLNAQNFPSYFATIKTEGEICSEDAQNDPLISKMAETYLKPLGITSLLGSGILKDATLVGVVCAEHIGKKRKWYPDEEVFINTISSFVGPHFAELDRRQAGEAMKESQLSLDSIIRSIPDIVYRLDKHGKIIFISDSVKSYGYTPSEMIGKNMFEYVYPGDKEKALHRINERRTGDRKTASFEIRLIPKNFENRHFEIRSSVTQEMPYFLLDAEGLYASDDIKDECFIGTQGVVRDITERKRSEHVRNQLLHDLQISLSEVKTLQGFLPICARCKGIRDDQGYWNKIESYISAHTDVKFSHGICEDCSKELYGDDEWYNPSKS